MAYERSELPELPLFHASIRMRVVSFAYFSVRVNSRVYKSFLHSR